MIKKKLLDWALDAIVAYLQENGPELIEKLVDWLRAMVEGAGEETFACPPCPEGCENFCQSLVPKYDAIVAEG